MLKLKTVTLRNFLSIGNVTQAVRLDDQPLTLVLGNNTDANGTTTKNGAGKTALLQAISFALYGTPLTKIKIDNLINNINGRGMMVTLDFEIDGRDYRIERGRKPNILKFFVNGEEIEDMSRGENRETQVDIATLVGMSHQMFTHIVALNTYTIPFLRLRAADQRDVSEELLGVTQISTRAETLKKLIAATKDALRQEEANINAAQNVNARVEAEIEQVEARSQQWVVTHKQQVDDLAAQIDELSVIDFDKEKLAFDALDAWNNHQRDLGSKLQNEQSALETIRAAITRAERELQQLVATDPSQPFKQARERNEKELGRKRADLARLEEECGRFQSEIEAVQSKIENPGDHQCVTCSQPLEGTDHIKTVMANLEKEKVLVEDKLQASISRYAEVECDIASLAEESLGSDEAELAAIKQKEDRKVELEAEITAEKKRQEEVEEIIQNMMDAMVSDEEKPQTFFDSRDELYATKHLLDQCMQDLERERVKENPHVPHIESLRATLQEIEFEEINRLNELFRHQDFLMKLLTNKESFVRKKIIEQNLYYLNTRLNFYLEKLGLPHEVVFQNDLSVDITLLGRDFDFEQLSRGEMNRVIMSVSWAFRDVWESLNHTINLVWVDELLDTGMDSAGAEAGLSVLKSFSRNRKNVFLISHRDELVGRIDRTLTVSKENGFTSIAEDLS